MDGYSSSEEEEEEEEEDRISQLDDEILVSIVSLLSIKDAVSISVLSKRWRYVWTYTLCLHLDAPKALRDYIPRTSKAREDLRVRYIDWGNQVLNSHQSLNLDEFSIRFGLDNTYGSDIDRWIEFAIKKRVKKLEIDIQLGEIATPFSKEYTLEKSYVYIQSPCGISNIKSLKHLSFSSVHVTGEILEYFLSHCPLLDHLSVVSSRFLSNLKVSGLSLRLKFLELRRCPCLESVEIYAPRLVSFVSVGIRKTTTISVKYAPSLVELTVGEFADHATSGFLSFSSNFSNLRTLSLMMDLHNDRSPPSQLPEFSNLQSLAMAVIVSPDESPFEWILSMLKASPFLQKFLLDFMWSGQKAYKKQPKGEKCSHQCLKVVELRYFRGNAMDTEIGLYLIENAVALEELIIHMRNGTFIVPRVELPESKRTKVARKQALKLGNELRSGAKFVLIEIWCSLFMLRINMVWF